MILAALHSRHGAPTWRPHHTVLACRGDLHVPLTVGVQRERLPCSQSLRPPLPVKRKIPRDRASGCTRCLNRASSDRLVTPLSHLFPMTNLPGTNDLFGDESVGDQENPQSLMIEVLDADPSIRRKGSAAAASALDGSPSSFRKPNGAIGLRVAKGYLSPLARKIFNVMICRAQQFGAPGKDAPISGPIAQQYYWVPFSEVVKDAAYDSRDYKLFKEHVDQLQSVRVVREADGDWTSDVLVPSVRIVNVAGRTGSDGRVRGGRLYLGFMFTPEVADLIMSPSRYTTLALYYQAMLKSETGLALYEVCRRYATNPSHLTMRQPWVWWYHALTGKAMADAPPTLEYKYVKRDAIAPAIREINLTTDITVALVEHKRGRKVIDLQFEVHLKEDTGDALASRPVIDSAILERIMRLGASQAEATGTYADYDHDYLVRTLDYVERRIRNAKLSPVGAPFVYLTAALKGRWAPAADAPKEAQLPSSESDVAAQKIQEIRKAYSDKHRADARSYYAELQPADQTALFAEFRESDDVTKNPRLRSDAGKRGISVKHVEVAFCNWLSVRLWGEPTDTDLLAFAATYLGRP